MKKIISILLCLCMVLSMALTAGAAEAKYVYVALGDEIASGEGVDAGAGFADLIAASIDAELVNLGQHGMTAAALLEQVTSGEIDEDLSRANLITITCVVHDTINLVFAKALESYNEEYDPDLTAEEMMDLLKSMNIADPRFMNLLGIATSVFDGDPANGIPPYLESEEFAAAMEGAMTLMDQTIAAIRAVNPGAAIVITNQYNPYAKVQGAFQLVSAKLEQGLAKLNEALAVSGYHVVDIHTPFAQSEENLCVASWTPRNLDFTPNAAGHQVIADTILANLPTLSPFVDVPTSEYYFEPVLWAVENEITLGIGHGKFAPMNTCTRGQIVTFLWRAAGCPEPTSTENPFDDVLETDYFFKPVLWAVENNITVGMGNGKFAPNNPCTRAQVVTFLWRAKDEPAANASSSFTDVLDTDWFAASVSWAVENGITLGIGNGLFGHNNPCTRGQIVTFLFRSENLQ